MIDDDDYEWIATNEQLRMNSYDENAESDGKTI